MDHQDERNVDEQLDEEQRNAEAGSKRPILDNHRNNARTDAIESSAISGAFSATGGTTVTDPSHAESGQTVTNGDEG